MYVYIYLCVCVCVCVCVYIYMYIYMYIYIYFSVGRGGFQVARDATRVRATNKPAAVIQTGEMPLWQVRY